MTSQRSPKAPVAKQKSHGVAKSMDPRVAKTRARIGAAFIELLGRRAYFRIRVSDITRKARVGRATFYAHFESKDALLKERFVAAVLPRVIELPDDSCLVDCTALFAHILTSPAIYRSLAAGPGRSATDGIVQDALESRIATLVATRAARGAGMSPTAAFVPRFVAGTILALIAWSLEQRPAPTPAELQTAYALLVGRALGAG
jgi:AcrR family transcriptional regulator